ncbi:MAG: hypothetical protein AAGF60_04930 [Pseudomonadota bacterium]
MDSTDLKFLLDSKHMTEKEKQLEEVMCDYCIRPPFKDEVRAIIESYVGSERHDNLIALRDRSLNQKTENLHEQHMEMIEINRRIVAERRADLP